MQKVILAKRYYGGCVNVDTVETLAIERAKKTFSVSVCQCFNLIVEAKRIWLFIWQLFKQVIEF
jgi:hypothetical protein